MKILFKVLSKETSAILGAGTLEFPDDKPAVEINDEMMKANDRIFASLFTVQYSFESEEQRQAFDERFQAEIKGPKIVGADGQPITKEAKIIKL